MFENKDYDRGFEDGLNYTKRIVLELLCESEEMVGREYVQLRNAVRNIEKE